MVKKVEKLRNYFGNIRDIKTIVGNGKSLGISSKITKQRGLCQKRTLKGRLQFEALAKATPQNTASEEQHVNHKHHE